MRIFIYANKKNKNLSSKTPLLVTVRRTISTVLYYSSTNWATSVRVATVLSYSTSVRVQVHKHASTVSLTLLRILVLYLQYIPVLVHALPVLVPYCTSTVRVQSPTRRLLPTVVAYSIYEYK